MKSIQNKFKNIKQKLTNSKTEEVELREAKHLQKGYEFFPN